MIRVLDVLELSLLCKRFMVLDTPEFLSQFLEPKF